jgi:hypothetical protein
MDVYYIQKIDFFYFAFLGEFYVENTIISYTQQQTERFLRRLKLVTVTYFPLIILILLSSSRSAILSISVFPDRFDCR